MFTLLHLLLFFSSAFPQPFPVSLEGNATDNYPESTADGLYPNYDDYTYNQDGGGTKPESENGGGGNNDEFTIDYQYLDELAGDDEKALKKWMNEIRSLLQARGDRRKTLKKWYSNLLKRYGKHAVGTRHCVQHYELISKVEQSTSGDLKDCDAYNSNNNYAACIK